MVFGQEKPLFEADVSLVHACAEVTDGTRLLTGFHREDFQVFDNQVLQPILYFSQSEEPLDLILLFDVSGSMAPKLDRVAAASRAALAELSRGDHVAVMTFGSKSTLILPFTEDLNEVERSIRSSVIGRAKGGTRILSAIDNAAQYFQRQPRTPRRRAVLIVTDNRGLPSGSKATVLRKLWEADAILSGLEIRTEREERAMKLKWISPTAALMSMENVNGLAERTGGDLMTGSDPAAQFQEMIRRIRLRYSLYYAMPGGKPGEERKIDVTLSEAARKRNPEARVRARTGYHAPKGDSK